MLRWLLCARTESAAQPSTARGSIARPQRARQGLSLLEAALVLLITIPVLTQVINLSAAYARQRAAELDARFLTDLAHAGRNLVLAQGQTFTIGTPLTYTPAQLQTAGLLDPGAAAQSATGRLYRIDVLPRSANEIIILARGSVRAGAPVFMTIPQAREGIKRVGLIHSLAPNVLRGPSLNYDLTWMTGAFAPAKPVAGDLVALDVVRRDQSITPYLHRTSNPLFPELNRMQTDLDMDGFDITGAGALVANQINIAQGLNAGSLSGATTIAGSLQTSTLTVSGPVSTTGPVTVAGSLTADSGALSGALNANVVEATAAQIAGDISTNALSADNVVALDAGLRHLASDLITAQQIISSARGDFQNLSTGSCSGC